MKQDQQSPTALPGTGANHAFYLGDWLVEPDLNRIQRNGEKAHLEPKVMEVLVCLSRANGSVISKGQLIRQVWPDTFVTDDVLKGSIWQLRKAFQDDSKHPSVIETIPKGGYRLLLPVRAQADSAADDSIVRPPKPNPKRWVWMAGITLAVLAGALSVLFLSTRKHREASLEIVPFTTLPGWEGLPSFSPDGHQIAFSYREGEQLDIFVKAIGDEKMLQLTEPPGLSVCPQWSPDGRFIAYWHGQTGSYDWAIYLMTSLGGAKRKLLVDINQAEEACLVSWSPDSKSVVYASRPSPDEPSGVFMVDVADPKPRRMTTAPNQMDDWYPSISHDGKQLAFIRQTDQLTRDLYVVPTSGGEPTRLTFLNAQAQHPVWASNDKRILFTSNAGGSGFGNDIYSVPVSGGTPERLPFSNHDARYPAISPQGDTLVYAKAYFDTNIWKVSLSDSTEPPTRFIASTQLEHGPAFSPDGSRIVFTSERDGTLANWICNADGSNLRRLSEIQRGGTPSWSPDGTSIVFDDRAGGRSHIYVMPAEGGTPVQLTGDDFDGQVPSWSADGNWIYFSSTRTGTSEIWKVSLRNKETVQVTRHGGNYAQESADGKFVYYDKPVGIWVMPTAGGPERMILSDPTISIFWHVSAEGIYYVEDAKPHPRVQLYRFATGKVTTVGHLNRFAWGAPGLGISPDGRTLLYAQVDSDTADLMLVKNGRW